MGVGSIVDTNHEGETKNPTEREALNRLDKWKPSRRKAPEDLTREREEREEKEREERLAKEAEREARAEQIRLSVVTDESNPS